MSTLRHHPSVIPAHLLGVGEPHRGKTRSVLEPAGETPNYEQMAAVFADSGGSATP